MANALNGSIIYVRPLQASMCLSHEAAAKAPEGTSVAPFTGAGSSPPGAAH